MLKLNKDNGFNGFQMTFENGWTVSVQFGKFNYADLEPNTPSSAYTAEIAAWDATGNWFEFSDGDKVKGHCTPDKVAEFIHQISTYPSLENEK